MIFPLLTYNGSTSNLYALDLVFVLFVNILDRASKFVPIYLAACPTLLNALHRDRRWIVYSSSIVIPFILV